MMQFLRRYGAPVFGAAAALLLVWTVWQLSGLEDSSSRLRNRSAGMVNGQPIDPRSYQLAVQQELDTRQRQGKAVGAEDAEVVRSQIWEQFIQELLLESEYRKLHLTASPDEIAGLLKSSPPPEFERLPDFQTEGKFDLAKYQRWLQSSGARAYLPQLEARYRDDILRGKLFQDVTADIFVSDPMLWRFYRDSRETVKLEIASIVPANAVPDSAVHLSADEVAAYYREHRDEFQRPRIAYLSYVTVPRLPDASDSAAALARAVALRKEILGGAPFAEVAKRESADSASAARGGDLGQWNRGSFDPAFESGAFSLPLNTISQPVLTADGYHLIEVTERKGNKAKGRHILIPVEVAGAHRDRLDAEADTLEELAAQHLDRTALDTVARVLHLKIGQASPLREGERVHLGLQPVPDAGAWAFQAKPGETSKVIEVSYAYFLFRLDSLVPAGIPPLEQIRSDVEMLARQAKKWPAARELGKQLEAKVKGGASVAQAAKALGVPNQTLGPFSRIDAPLGDPVIVGAAFALDSGKVSRLIETKQGLYLLRCLGRTKADSSLFAKQGTEARNQLTRQLRQQRVRNYLVALRESAKVEDRRAEIFKTEAQTESSP